MGQLKALLPWQGTTLLAYQVSTLLSSPVERLIVVLGHRAGELRAHLPAEERIRVVVNPEYHSGKVSSIVAGVRASDTSRHLLILGVDQPRPARLVTKTVEAHQTLITIAGFGGRRGHPVIFAGSLHDELLALDEAKEGLRAVLRRHLAQTRIVDTGDPLALVNLNTPEDLAAALQLLEHRSVP